MGFDFARAGIGAATFGGSEYFGMAQRTLGGLMGGGGGGDLYSRELIDKRRAEINDFASQLTGARQKYLTSLGNMYDKAYTRFSGNAEVGFASRGLAVNGGAFASALAKESARYQSELEPTAFQAEREDLNAAEGYRNSLFSSVFNADANERGAKFENSNANSRSIGGFAAQLGLMGAGYALGGPVGAGVASKVGSQWVGGNGSFGNSYKPRTLNLSGRPGVY